MLLQAILLPLPRPRCWAVAEGWGGIVGPGTEGAEGVGENLIPHTCPGAEGAFLGAEEP